MMSYMLVLVLRLYPAQVLEQLMTLFSHETAEEVEPGGLPGLQLDTHA
jgi:hypothetical protein